MNRPSPKMHTADDSGQQDWSAEEASAVARLLADPAYQEDIAAGLASIARGEGYTTEDVLAELMRRRAAR